MSLYGNNDKVLNSKIAILEEEVKGHTGTTAERPVFTDASSHTYFDTSFGVPIWWTGSVWVDATGAEI